MRTLRVPVSVPLLVVTASAALSLFLSTCASSGRDAGARVAAGEPGPGVQPDVQPDVMESAFCKTCHPVIYAEHAQNTHGRAFFDGEARLATPAASGARTASAATRRGPCSKRASAARR